MSTIKIQTTAATAKADAIRQIISFLKNLETGQNKIMGRDSTENIQTDLEIMVGCPHCNDIQNTFWCYVVPMRTQVIMSCKFISPLSLLLFFVVRKAKLSLHRLKSGQLNSDDWNRIEYALKLLESVRLDAYDLRYDDTDDYQLDTYDNFYHIAF